MEKKKTEVRYVSVELCSPSEKLVCLKRARFKAVAGGCVPSRAEQSRRALFPNTA